MAAEGIYQHYLPSERDFIDKSLDWIRQVVDKQFFRCTYFLNPREREILENLSAAEGVQFFSSPPLAESQKVILAPDYYRLEMPDFDLALIEIEFPSKFGQLSHRQVLGTLLGETGLERREIGDILISGADGRAQFYVSQHLVSHFVSSVKKIGGLAVRLSEVPLSEALTVEEESVRSVILVSSLRLDKIVAASLNISRNSASNMIQSGQIKVNYSRIIKADHLLDKEDLVSIRGYGRIKVLHLLGFTKKDKMKIEISRILSRKGK
ncbi:YlmH family RNA-binding protein [Lactovum odontotermitis]